MGQSKWSKKTEDGKKHGVGPSLTQLRGGLHQHGGQDLHGRLSKGGNKARTIVSVALSSTEALARQDANTLLDGLRLLHKVGDPGHDGGAVVTGPVAEETLHLAKTNALTGVASSDESRIEAVGHVSPPLRESRLTSGSISSLGADLGDQDPGLLSDRLGRGQPGQKSSSSLVALLARRSKGGGGEAQGGGEQQNLHDLP